MKKSHKILYWFFTIWLSLGMVSTGLVQIMRSKDETDLFARLGYPVYLLTILGVWKILGVAAVLVPRFPLVKEWAYAGFFFAMSGAVFSHAANGGTFKDFFGPVLLILLTGLSWYFRPADRKLVSE